MGVFASILKHLLGDWSDTPVCELVFFVSQNLAVSLQKESQTELLHRQGPRGLASIEHVNQVEAKVSLQPLDVRVSTMEDLHDFRVVKDASQ